MLKQRNEHLKVISHMLYNSHVIVDKGYIIYNQDYIQLKALSYDKTMILDLKIFNDTSYTYEFEVIQ